MKAGVADPNAFKDRPEILMYGMLCVMIAAAFWDIFRCGRVGGREQGKVWTRPCNPTIWLCVQPQVFPAVLTPL